jgi:hypothetical protein
MPRAETGDGVSAVRSRKELTAAATGEGNALGRAQGCLSASGVTKLMILGVIVAGVLCSTLRCGPYPPKLGDRYVSHPG